VPALNFAKKRRRSKMKMVKLTALAVLMSFTMLTVSAANATVVTPPVAKGVPKVVCCGNSVASQVVMLGVVLTVIQLAYNDSVTNQDPRHFKTVKAMHADGQSNNNFEITQFDYDNNKAKYTLVK